MPDQGSGIIGFHLVILRLMILLNDDVIPPSSVLICIPMTSLPWSSTLKIYMVKNLASNESSKNQEETCVHKIASFTRTLKNTLIGVNGG